MKKSISPARPLSPLLRDGLSGWALALALVSLLGLMLWLSFDYGITWDEGYQDLRGEKLLNFYRSGFTKRGVLDYHHYGAFYDVLCRLIQNLFSSYPPYEVRHLLNSFFGWIGIVSTVLLARRLFGMPGAVFSLLLVCTSPRYLAHCMNNSKDMPFASFTILFLFLLSKTTDTFPYLSKKRLLGLLFLFALSLGIRQGALLLPVCAGLVIFVLAWREQLPWPRLIRALFIGITGLAVGILFTSLFWPAILLTKGVLNSVPTIVNYTMGGATNLFMGEMLEKGPRYYSLVYFWITLPLAVIFPGVLSFLLLREKRPHPIVYALLLTAFLPFVVAVLLNVRLYNEIRHLLFAYPPLVILASGVWAWLWKISGERRGGLALCGLLFGILIFDPLRFQIRNHPNEIVYYNPIIGGVKGAYTKFELDYWGNCYKTAADWLSEHTKESLFPVPVSSGFGGEVLASYVQKYPNLQMERYFFDSEYWIRSTRGDRTLIERTVEGRTKPGVPAAETVFRVEADGVPLCVVQRNVVYSAPRRDLSSSAGARP